MDLRQLRHVVEICGTGSFSAAARRLKVSQPTLSKSISQLESQLNVTLFERSGGAALPTQSGAFFAEQAAKILSAVSSLDRDVKLHAHGKLGPLRIGAAGMTRERPLPMFVQLLREKYPALQIETRSEVVESLVRELRAGRYDVIFCSSEYADDAGDLIRIKLYEEPEIIVARPDHPIVKEAQRTPEKLLRYPIAAISIFPSFRRHFGALSAQSERNLYAFTSAEPLLIKNRLSEGNFIGLGTRTLFRQELREGSLVEVPVPGLPRYVCWMLTTEGRWRSAFIKEVAAVARAASRPVALPDRGSDKPSRRQPGARKKAKRPKS